MKRTDRSLLEDPVPKLKFQNSESVVDFIDAAQNGQYAAAALTTQFPSMVARIRCRLVIRVLRSLPGPLVTVCWMLHLNVLQRNTLRW